jgi:phenylalanyl-tRNA synthetase alpha chain
MKNQIEHLKKEFSNAVQSATSGEQLEKVRVTFLGRKGTLTDLMASIKTMSADDKREYGPLLNSLKQELEQAFTEKHTALLAQERAHQEYAQRHFDVSAYKTGTLSGSLHIYSQLLERIEDIFISMGYNIADGPEAEFDYYNFQALNIPQDHPARDMQDTFWLNVPDMLLRTQTSAVQVREMEKKGAPLAIIAPGRVYRHEATDASHDFMFSQIEGLVVGKDISMAHLLTTAQTFLQEFFEKKDLNIRVRPGFFPFVEPGIEIDMSCPFCAHGCSVCKQTEWIEIMPGGLVHPNVLRAGGIDPTQYSAFAFGAGLERIAMIKHGIDDIRLFHSGSLEFLKQF